MPHLVNVTVTASSAASRGSTRLHVSHLPQNTTLTEIQAAISACLVSVSYTRDDLQQIEYSGQRSFAFITLSSAEAADALLGASPPVIRGARLRLSRPRNFRPPPGAQIRLDNGVTASATPKASLTVHISNVPYGSSEAEVRTLCEGLGALQRFHVVRSKKQATVQVFADYVDPEAARDALNKLPVLLISVGPQISVSRAAESAGSAVLVASGGRDATDVPEGLVSAVRDYNCQWRAVEKYSEDLEIPSLTVAVHGVTQHCDLPGVEGEIGDLVRARCERLVAKAAECGVIGPRTATALDAKVEGGLTLVTAPDKASAFAVFVGLPQLTFRGRRLCTQFVTARAEEAPEAPAAEPADEDLDDFEALLGL